VKRLNAVLAIILFVSLGAGFYLGWDMAKMPGIRSAFAAGEDEPLPPLPSVDGADSAEQTPAEPSVSEPVLTEPVSEPADQPAAGPVLPGDNQSGGKKTVYLTFDDGPSANTPKVLDILQRYGIKATFFVNGRDSDFGKQMYRRMADEGHAIGNHTYSHDYSLVYSSVEAYIADTRKLGDLLAATVGVRPSVIRFPGGSANHSSWEYSGPDFMTKLTQRMVEAGYRYFDWNVSAGDAAAGVTPAAEIVAAVQQGVAGRQSAIILCHDGAKQTTTVEALPEIIEYLQEQGCAFAVLTPDGFAHRFI